MGATQRGTSIYIVERVSALDPLTQQATPADPTTVVFTVEDPDGGATTYTSGVDSEVTNPEVGTYVLALSGGSAGPLPTGIWTYRFDGTGAVVVSEEKTFEILASGVLAPSGADVATAGPCQAWIDGDDVAAYDEALGVGSDTWRLDDVAWMASQVMYEASGRQFAGICRQTVRPSRRSCSCWGTATLVSAWSWYGYLGSGWGWHDEAGIRRGCSYESTVKLSGYPVREILEVKIDGVPLATTGEYRLDDRRILVRLDDPGPPVQKRVWPGCQNLSLPDTEPGTFAVTYSFGQQPSELGKMAAAALAAELFKAITPGTPDCRLPTSVTKVVRQGITIERVVPTARMVREGSTGIQAIDLFVTAVNPDGLQRRAAVWSPDVQAYARRVGQ